MRFPKERIEALKKFPQWRTLCTHSALFKNHIALSVKLAEDGAQQSLALHPHEQFQFVRRYGDKIRRMIVARVGVHPTAAISCINSVELVLHDHLTMILHQFLKLLIQLLPLRRLLVRILQVGDFTSTPHLAHPAFLRAHRVPHFFLRSNDLYILLVILGSNRRRALKHHVLKQMRHASDAWPFVHAAHTRHPAAGNTWRIIAFEQQHLHAVRKLMLLHCHLLRPQP